MSHYTVGAGSRADLQRYARQADKARAAVLKRALGLLAGRIGRAWPGKGHAGMAPLQR